MNVLSRPAIFALCLFGSLLVPAAEAVEITGRVVNATTGEPVPGQFVTLLALRGQMVPVRETHADDRGRYRFVVAANPSERFLVRVPFRGVNYHEPAALAGDERITADVTVYEPGADSADIRVEAQTIFLEPHQNHVRISEFFALANRSRPPRTYNPDQGSFRFALPEPLGDLQVSAGRAGSMPLRQAPQPTGEPGEFAIQFPLHPGETEVQVSYTVPVEGTAFELRLPLRAPAERRHLALPKQGVEIESADLTELSQERVPQARVFAIDTPVPGELTLALRVDPEALRRAQAAAPDTPAGPQASPGQATVQIIPHPVTRARWYILGLALVVLLLGLYYLSSLQPASQATDESAGQRRPH